MSGRMFGTDNPQAKLTPAAVQTIRSAAGRTDADLAREFGVRTATVRLVRLNLTWVDKGYSPRAAVVGAAAVGRAAARS